MTADMNALRALIDQVQPGWTVEVTNHDYIAESGTATVTSVSDTQLRSRRGKQERHFNWPAEGSDFEVDGLTLRTYNPRHAYTGGRAIVLTLVFSPPQEER